jgi:hypothetical protein
LPSATDLLKFLAQVTERQVFVNASEELVVEAPNNRR